LNRPGPGPKNLRIQSDHHEARRARRWIAEQIDAAGFSGDDFAECVLAFGEAVSNVIRHAYGETPGQPIDIEVRAHADLVRIVIRDRAPSGFSPPPGKAAPRAEDLAEGGYGIHLIHRAMDDVRYVRTGDGVNELHLLKMRSTNRRAAS
jgi:serine/threonine-protein kinase RsbW